MTTQEFSSQFDTLINAYNMQANHGNSFQPLEFDEYEKSVFLTLAQEEVVISLYSGNGISNSFESTEEVRRYLANLTRTLFIDTEKTEGGNPALMKGVISRSAVFPTDIGKELLYIVQESIQLPDSDDPCLSGKVVEVVPITHDTYNRIMKNPFRRPSNKKAFRLDLDKNKVEILYSMDTPFKYWARYLTKPKPIVLTNLREGLSINGEREISQCELHNMLHRVILETAVRMAVSSRSIGSSKDAKPKE